MTANLFGERFVGRTPAWHQLGSVIPDLVPDAVEAMHIAGLDYEIHKVPLTASIPGAEVINVPNKMALVREPHGDAKDWDYLGVVGSNYEVIQNLDVAQLLNAIGLPEKWPIETVGALGNGETFFMALKVGTTELFGDANETVEEYFLVTDTRNGKSAFKILYTPVRVVCQNTLMASLDAATRITSVAHNRGAQIEVSDRLAIMANLDAVRQTTLDDFSALAYHHLSSKGVSVALTNAYPFPARPSKLDVVDSLQANVDFQDSTFDDLTNWAPGNLERVRFTYQRECARIESLRDGAKARYDIFCTDHPEYAETSWALFNAVVEHEDFRDGPKNLYQNALWGDRAKTKVRAFEYLRNKAVSA